MFDQIRIVLVATTHPGNIGSTARAMKTMGFENLYLVSPKYFPDAKAIELASGADDVLVFAKVFDNLPEALSGCHAVFATSARTRGIPLPIQSPKQCAEHCKTQLQNQHIAIVFGREHAGLTNRELEHCHAQVVIPSNADYSSLNLAAAVQVICYELRCALLANQTNQITAHDSLATHDEVEQFYQHLQQILIDIDFLDPNNPRKLMPRLRRLFNRAHLETREVNILRGILTNVNKIMG